MTKKEIKDAIEYWKKTAGRDYDTMLGLFKIKRYPESLFFGHIVLEKVLKGLIVKNTNEQPLYTHDLPKLARLSNIISDKKESKLLKDINVFNMRARYPEQKLKLYKICNEKYAKERLENISNMYKKLCKKLEQ